MPLTSTTPVEFTVKPPVPLMVAPRVVVPLPPPKVSVNPPELMLPPTVRVDPVPPTENASLALSVTGKLNVFAPVELVASMPPESAMPLPEMT